MMDKKDAIDYLLYMKHDVQAGSPMDIALDTAIEALEATAKMPEVRHGRWQFLAQKNGYLWKCSACNGNFDQQYRFCPYCGALMHGGAKDATD